MDTLANNMNKNGMTKDTKSPPAAELPKVFSNSLSSSRIYAGTVMGLIIYPSPMVTYDDGYSINPSLWAKKA